PRPGASQTPAPRAAPPAGLPVPPPRQEISIKPRRMISLGDNAPRSVQPPSALDRTSSGPPLPPARERAPSVPEIRERAPSVREIRERAPSAPQLRERAPSVPPERPP